VRPQLAPVHLDQLTERTLVPGPGSLKKLCFKKSCIARVLALGSTHRNTLTPATDIAS
jgi:hypothetical protein